MRTYLAIISHRDALRWVLSEGRMAFPRRREQAASRLRSRDRVLLYTTRGCFRYPGHDRGRVIGEATITGRVEHYEMPLVLAGREFSCSCTLNIDSLAPLFEGVELSPEIHALSLFADHPAWPSLLRRPILELPPDDAAHLRRLLRRLAQPPSAHLDDYLSRRPRSWRRTETTPGS